MDWKLSGVIADFDKSSGYAMLRDGSRAKQKAFYHRIKFQWRVQRGTVEENTVTCFTAGRHRLVFQGDSDSLGVFVVKCEVVSQLSNQKEVGLLAEGMLDLVPAFSGLVI